MRKARKAPAAAATAAQNPPQAQDAAAVSSQEPNATLESILTKGNHLLIKDIDNDQNIVKTAAEYEGKENVIIENLKNCVVILPFSIKSLYVKNIEGTRIYVGSVSGASFVNKATDCMIHLQSHQIRIHNSLRVQFYLTARSNPIIEHCQEMSFGPYIDPATEQPALEFEGWLE